MPGNTSVEKTKCDSANSNSVSKLFYGLLNKKCQQQPPVTSNPQLRRSFKLLKVHRSESNLPFKQQHSSVQPIDQLNQLNKLAKPMSTGSLCDLKMKSNESALLTSAQIATVIPDSNEPDDDEELPPIPPPRNSSLSLRPSLNNQHNQHNQPAAGSPINPNYNRELPSLPIVEEKRKSISFSSRLSPISDDGGFNSFDYSSPNKRNSISVLNNRNFSNGQPYRNNLFNQGGNFFPQPPSHRYGALISSNDKWSNMPAFNNNFQESNGLFDNRRGSYFSEVDQHLDLDYQNIGSNNYALGSQKSDNWSSSTSVLSYSGITSSSTSDYYTASSETITNSPSLSSLNSAGLCASSTNTCSSPPLNCNKTLVSNHVGHQLNSNKSMPYMRQPFSFPGSQLPSTPTKLAKCPAIPTNTGIAVSSLVEKPKRQESASVLYYIVAKDADSPNGNHNHNSEFNDVSAAREPSSEQQVDGKLASSPFNESSQLSKFTNSTNYANHQNNNKSLEQPNQADLKAIQRSLHEFYLRHKGNLKDQQADHQSNNHLSKKSSLNSNLINYSLTSNDSACSDSSTVSPANSPTLFPKLPTIALPAKPDFLNAPKQLTPEEEERLNELKSKAIYSNVHFDSLNGFEAKENGNDLQSTNKELRLSFRERCSPFENKSPRQTYPEENKTRNELRNLNQPNSVKSIAKQFDSLSSLNCDLNANRVSPVSLAAGKTVNSNSALSNSELNGSQSKPLSFALDGLMDTPAVAAEGSEQKDAQLNEPNSDEASVNDTKASLESGDLNEEHCRLKLKENEEKLKLFLEFLRKNELSKAEYSKLTLHIEEVDKVTKLIISLSSRLNKIEGILQLRSQQQSNSEPDAEPLNDGQLANPASSKYKQSTSTDSLLDEKNLFSSILSLSSISLNNLNCNGSAFFASIEMLNSKKNKILDQLEEATQLKQMIEKRCKNLNDRIICKYYDFAGLNFEASENREFASLKGFDFVATMRHKHELSIRSRELELSARLVDK